MFRCLLIFVLFALAIADDSNGNNAGGKESVESVILKKLTELSGKVDYIQAALQDRPYSPGRNVFLVRSSKGTYNMTSTEAKSVCKKLGGSLATYSQLQTAYDLGLSICGCGWLADGTAQFPHHWPAKHCGWGSPGIRKCTWRHHWDAYCYKSHYQGSKFITD